MRFQDFISRPDIQYWSVSRFSYSYTTYTIYTQQSNILMYTNDTIRYDRRPHLISILPLRNFTFAFTVAAVTSFRFPLYFLNKSLFATIHFTRFLLIPYYHSLRSQSQIHIHLTLPIQEYALHIKDFIGIYTQSPRLLYSLL